MEGGAGGSGATSLPDKKFWLVCTGTTISKVELSEYISRSDTFDLSLETTISKPINTRVMGPKRKDFLKPGKPKGKLKASEPQTENDFLEAADEHEQAAGKWRAGDAVKATRFFNRAIDTYNEGLKKHPQSFDLAYNKYASS